MCFAIPGQILSKWQEPDGAIMAEADFQGQKQKIKLNFLPDLEVGDYTIVHAGFALTKVPPKQVEEVIASMNEAGIL